MIQKIFALGPIFFGICIFAPMWAAVATQLALPMPLDLAPIEVTLGLGFVIGLQAKLRGRWI